MPIPNHSYHPALTPSGITDSRYRDGNDGAGAIPLTWAAIPSSLGNQEGATVSINLRAYLTEPGSPAATLSLIGNPPAGWSLVGDLVQYTGTGQGSGAVQGRAVRLAVTQDSPFFTIESIASAAVDTEPPTQVTGLVAQIISGPQVVLGWDAASDVKTSAVTASGIADYQPTRNGADLGSPVLAPSVGLSLQLTNRSIGVPVPAVSSFLQASADYSYTVGGDAGNFLTAADICAFPSVQVTGNLTATDYVTLITGPATLSNTGIMFRADQAIDAPFVYLAKYQDAGGGGLRLIWRALKGAVPVQGAIVPGLTGETLVRLTRGASDLFTAQRWNGSNWVTVDTATVGMTDPIYVSFPANSGVSGSSISVIHRQVNIQNIAGSTKTDSTVVAGGSYVYAVKSRDVAGNVAAPGPTVTVSIPASGGRAVPGRLASHYIGGNKLLYCDAAMMQFHSRMSLFTMAFYDGLQSASGMTLTTEQIITQIKAQSPLPVPSLAGFYYDPQIVPLAGSTIQALMTAAKWWLYTSYPSGSIVSIKAGYGETNMTAGGPTSSGRTFQQFIVDYWYDVMVGGGAAGLATVTTGHFGPCTLWDYSFQDDFNLKARAAGDYDRNGASEALATLATDQAFRTGVAAMGARMLAKMPGKYITANIAPVKNLQWVTTGLDNLYYGGALEGAMGATYSQETNNGWGACIDSYKHQMDFSLAPKLGVFFHNNVTADGKDPYRTNAYQASRYGFMTCVNGEGYHFASNGYQAENRNWFDEYSFDPASGACTTMQAATAASLTNYDNPIDPPYVKTAYQQGVMRRRFVNAAGKTVHSFVNPRGNGTKTINFGGATLRALAGINENTVNNGSLATGATIPEQDGRVFLSQ